MRTADAPDFNSSTMLTMVNGMFSISTIVDYISSSTTNTMFPNVTICKVTTCQPDS